MFRPRYQITEDREYLVLGISFLVNSEVYGNCCLFTIQDDATRCVMVPGALFEITDSKASRHWIVKNAEGSNLTLWPEEFYAEFFHDRVTDYEPEALAALRAAVIRIEDEMQVPV
jgi:hypothetical protein